jgi:predicted metal-dependent hydrolase
MKTDHSIRFGVREIRYVLHRAERKTLRIVVSPDLTVKVLAPKSVNQEDIRSAVQRKAPWITRKLDQLRSFHPLPAPKRYMSGETVTYLGRQYRLKVQSGPNQLAKLKGRFLWVWVKDKTDRRSIKGAVEAWYRKRARETLGRQLDKAYAIGSRHGVLQPSLTIRAMRRRWGSCSSGGKITLNVHLVQAPLHCIEYVAMHELCHTRHHNHSKSFYSLLTRCMPDWKQRKDLLERVII